MKRHGLWVIILFAVAALLAATVTVAQAQGTLQKVKDSGTVNSTSDVPMPDRKVIQVGQGTLKPAIFTALASRRQPDSQMNR